MSEANKQPPQQPVRKTENDGAAESAAAKALSVPDNERTNATSALPRDVYSLVMVHLDVLSLSKLSLVCKDAWEASQSDEVWGVALRRKPELPPKYDIYSYDYRFDAKTARCLSDLSRSAVPRLEGEGWRAWFLDKFVGGNGFYGTYKYHSGAFNDGCCFDFIYGWLGPGAFEFYRDEVEEYGSVCTVVKGTRLRWMGDHLLLEGTKRKTDRCRGPEPIIHITSDWTGKVYFGIHCRKYFGETKEEFKRNKGTLVAFIEGLGATYLQRGAS